MTYTNFDSRTKSGSYRLPEDRYRYLRELEDRIAAGRKRPRRASAFSAGQGGTAPSLSLRPACA